MSDSNSTSRTYQTSEELITKPRSRNEPPIPAGLRMTFRLSPIARSVVLSSDSVFQEVCRFRECRYNHAGRFAIRWRTVGPVGPNTPIPGSPSASARTILVNKASLILAIHWYRGTANCPNKPSPRVPASIPTCLKPSAQYQL